MANHFEALGFPVRDEPAFQELLSAAFDHASERGEVVEHAEGRTLTYRDPSGATLSIHVDRRNKFTCCQPGLEGQFHTRWRPLGIVRDESCPHCDLVSAELIDEGDELIYPFALTVETLGAERALIPYDEPAEVRFAGLWEEGELWPDEASFAEAQQVEWGDVEVPEAIRDEIPALGGFASRSLIPSGTFALDGETTSHVLAHGLVESVEERHNELGNAPFRVVRLDTLGGVFDTCLAPGTLEREDLLSPGAVARATLWLVGRPLTLRDEPGPVPEVEGERPKRSGFVRRLFGR